MLVTKPEKYLSECVEKPAEIYNCIREARPRKQMPSRWNCLAIMSIRSEIICIFPAWCPPSYILSDYYYVQNLRLTLYHIYFIYIRLRTGILIYNLV